MRTQWMGPAFKDFRSMRALRILC